ncbi:MAG: TlpA family protein disulfide reductase [Ruminococcaceae bacterium]|nr:TlpA family protein disulfide reductase [Oscillospiraceae bacterium]
MEKIKKLIKNKVFLWSAVGVLVAAAVIVAVVLLAGNGNNPDDGTKPGSDVTYTVQVQTNAGNALADIDVYVYADSALTDMVNVARTGEDGVATFTAPAGTYAVVLKNVPAGYLVEASYAVTEKTTQIVLTAELIEKPDLSKDKFGLGSVMFDFVVTDTENNSYKLSQLLQQKKAVVLNFWFANCNPCKAEFPYLQEAYLNYSEDIALLAVTPVNDAATVAQFRTEQGLTIPMASVDAAWEKAFGLIGYPTTVVIDRFGNINFVHVGSVDDTPTWENLFAYYADDNYTQKTDLDIEDFAEAYEQGTADNPLEFGGVMEFEVTAEPGESIYCHVYKASGMILTVEDTAVSILYNETTYTPENGVVSFPVESPDTYTPVELVFTNTGSEQKTYQVKLSYPAGTMGNPFELQLGSFTVDVPAGTDQGVYYKYIADQTGELTVKCVGIDGDADYTFTLYNLNTYVYVVLDTESTSDSLTIAVNAGDELQFTAGSLPNEENEYPAIKLDFNASFKKTAETQPTTPAPTTPAPTEPKPTTPAPTQPTTPTPTSPTPTDPPATEPEASYTDLYDGEYRAYHIALGNNGVNVAAGDITYFLFVPERSGQYRFTTTAGTLGYNGTNLSFIADLSMTLEDYSEKSFTVNIKDSNIGSSYLIHIIAPAGVNNATIGITRVGDAILSWEDLPYEVYNGTYTPKTFTFAGGTVKYVDVTGKASDFVPVLGSDGYYHLNSANGSLLYVNLKNGAYPDCALNTMLHSNRPIVQGTVKDENGNNVSKEQYNDLVQKYIDCSDDGLYPMTADLMRILKTQNDNWYLYLASENADVEKEMAWMCNVCYVP